jgi:acetyltransferase-like isoleucine patch superfamily enzyme
MNRNHPLEFKSTHALFFNPSLGISKQDEIEFIPLEIGNDVWIGHNAIIMPHVRLIGNGAVIAAGAVVNKDVPPYAVMVGNPARVVRYRFSQDTIDTLQESRWWEKSIDQLQPEIEEYLKPYVEKTEHEVV